MELSTIHHIEPEKLEDFKAELFVATLSHELRCMVIPKLLERMKCRKIALYYAKQTREQDFENNKKYFLSQGFELICVDKEVPDIPEILAGHEGDRLNLLFDCTSMTQGWYYEFFRWFSESPDSYERVRLRFAYSMAAYVHDDSPKKVRGMKEFLERQGKSKARKKALLLGLGHEAGVADSIVKLEKPDHLLLFYADPPVDKRFVEQIFVNNHALINQTPINQLIAYPIHNGQKIYQSLIDSILPLRNTHSISLVPQGPKIFSLAAMLVHLGYPDTRIAYPHFKKAVLIDRVPYGKPVIIDVCFEGEE